MALDCLVEKLRVLESSHCLETERTPWGRLGGKGSSVWSALT